MFVSSEGDYGDFVYLLGVLSELSGGPHSVVLRTSDGTKIRSQEDLSKFADMVISLALEQPYISEARKIQDGDTIQWHSGGFRGVGVWCPKATLLEAKSHYLTMVHNIGHGISGRQKWLTVEPDSRTKGRIVVNRTGRYRNGYFPWNRIMDHYGDLLVFIGLPHEYRDFCGQFGGIPFIRTHTMLDVARLVAGSEMVIANQSCVNACAEGLKHRMIQETNLGIPDCIWRRGNAQHVSDGGCRLPDIGGSGELHVPTQFSETLTTKRSCPPGLWQFHGQRNNSSIAGMVDAIYMKEKRRRPKSEIEMEVVAENIRRVPDHFMDKSSRCVFDVFHEAYKNSPC